MFGGVKGALNAGKVLLLMLAYAAGLLIPKEKPSNCLVRIRGHGRAMPGCPLPIVDPAPADRFRSFDKIVTRSLPMFDHEDDAGIEMPLRVVYVR